MYDLIASAVEYFHCFRAHDRLAVRSYMNDFLIAPRITRHENLSICLRADSFQIGSNEIKNLGLTQKPLLRSFYCVSPIAQF